MAEFIEALFVRPIQISGIGRLAMLLPLTLSVSIVYKTTKCNHVREVPLASIVLWITIVVGMYAVGVGLLLLYNLLA